MARFAAFSESNSFPQADILPDNDWGELRNVLNQSGVTLRLMLLKMVLQVVILTIKQ